MPPQGKSLLAELLRNAELGPSGAAPADPQHRLPPVLLTSPTYYGTLAAVRCLGRSGVRVATAGTSRWAISGWSKYTSRHLLCPSTNKADQFIAWLQKFGEQQSERHVLLPTCDNTAWLYARHRDQLSRHFYLSSSDITALHGLLHKGLLAEHTREVGLQSPRTWFPQTVGEARAIAARATFPVLVKPVTQVLSMSGSKGVRVDTAAALPKAYALAAALRHGRAIGAYDRTATCPMVQEFFHGASNGIYNISSYAQGGKLWGARAARKILQRPRRVGIGVCFEEAPLDPSLVAGLERLVQRVAFNGVFEAEFVKEDGRAVLIDFNPRFYNQMVFDVARGLPLPLLAYCGALEGERAQAVPTDVASSDSTGKVFTYGSAFKVMIASQRLSGALATDEADRWLSWYDAHEGKRVDAVSDPDDPVPARIDTLQMVHRSVRYPRAFVRSIVLNR